MAPLSGRASQLVSFSASDHSAIRQSLCARAAIGTADCRRPDLGHAQRSSRRSRLSRCVLARAGYVARTRIPGSSAASPCLWSDPFKGFSGRLALRRPRLHFRALHGSHPATRWWHVRSLIAHVFTDVVIAGIVLLLASP